METTQLKASLLIPTYNAGERWPDVLQSIAMQDFQFHRIIIVDSGSKDNTVMLAKQYNFEVITIPQSQFNHGATRQLLVDLTPESDIAVFLTQDAILSTNNSVSELVNVFNDASVALAYGRQFPHKGAKPLEAHARQFNYPAWSDIRAFADKDKLGFKVFFCSNSFAAYRISALNKAGGFPSESIMGEDAIVAARLLLNEHSIAYVSEAAVNHSHSYNFGEEFRRYFDTRVFHEQNPWLIQSFGKPTGEGLRYVKSELNYVMKTAPANLPKVFTSILAKLSGYTLGKYYRMLPKAMLKRLSMHKAYWK